MINQTHEVKFRVRIARFSAAAAVFGFASLNFTGGAISDPAYDTSTSVRTGTASLQVAKRVGSYRVGDPYVIAGRTYTPREEPDYRAEGTASWYGDKFHGRLTANGEIFDTFALSAAHPTLPLPSYVRVTNLENRRSLVVRLNDRGPFHDNRLIDVSVKTAQLLGFYEQGLAKVRVDYLGPAELEGSDDGVLLATLRDGDRLVTELAAVGPVQPSEDEAVVTAETGPIQPLEIETPTTVAVEASPVAPSDAERSVAAVPEPALPELCTGAFPVMAIAQTPPVWQRKRRQVEFEIAEPVVALIPQTVPSNDDDGAAAETGASTFAPVDAEQILL